MQEDQVLMKASICTKYGGPEVLQLEEVPKPAPGDNEVLVRIHSTSVNYGDLTARNFRAVTPKKFNMPLLFWFFAKLYFGLRRPKINILGSEFSGVVETAGNVVENFKPGDPVFGYLGQKMGAYAEYLSMPETGTISLKPENMRFEEAAAAPYGAIMAFYLLGRAGIREGRKVLIIGASGSIGSAAVQIAKNAGAEVTGVCGSTGMEYVKKLGADRVIDYRKEDFSAGGAAYDLIFDVLGRSSFSAAKKVLTKNGIYFRVSFKLGELVQMLITRITGGKKVVCTLAPGGREDLERVRSLIAAGKLRTIVAKTFPLADAAAAHRYAESGGKQGSVVLQIIPS